VWGWDSTLSFQNLTEFIKSLYEYQELLFGERGRVLQRKLLAFLAVMLFVFSLVGVVKAQNDTSVWRDDLNYSSFDQFQAAGWSSLHPTGISLNGTGVILDGTQGDNTISYSNRFPSGIYDWKVEARSKWTLGSCHVKFLTLHL
jgi:hypothetical protein